MPNLIQRTREKARRFARAKEAKSISVAESPVLTSPDEKHPVDQPCPCAILSSGVDNNHDDNAAHKALPVENPDKQLHAEISPRKEVPETQPVVSESATKLYMSPSMLAEFDDEGPHGFIHNLVYGCSEEPSNVDATRIEAESVLNTPQLAKDVKPDLNRPKTPPETSTGQRCIMIFKQTIGTKQPSKLERTTSALNMKELWESPSLEHSSLVNGIVCKTNKPGTFGHYGAETHRLKDLTPYLYPFTNAELVVEWSDRKREKVVANIRHERLGYLVKYNGEPTEYRGPALQHLIRQLEGEWEKKHLVVKKLTCTYIEFLRLLRGILRWIRSLLGRIWTLIGLVKKEKET
ncbi:hypothetical protein HBI56_158520 [Parastagonospora nodorum]|uniref:Uncharacterized protein n=2 Tax=Phaeosphaeria nodorum (strain SN15 / ATCC MYA-4574 / FGSC 10173) TaxID=321614 RepID=A0A7U2ET42_PHANO|nr:hypothetical protein SNOG_02446 [Parastagonospora nodorum SN15]KAH3907456.1 hypothetical protein HBH56_189240 [Parastagonospora nodorum]EAT90658.1 hypothetical protein SNOG_02446 [Parastagonospora nodorum SN15]KAH3925180.1 hypothetical protein HBH54_185050 [Parastagonospora nodorum]KAH3954514.1 hypothetical protein HBH53_024400 [Parastagonospora nodorum]KAH3963690.1 hypothetical protein HBH51_164240 [Parastagonospora nodorum]